MAAEVVPYLVWATVPIGFAFLAMRVMRVGPADTRRGGSSGMVWLDTQSAFDRARWRHIRWWLEMSLTGRGRAVALPVLEHPYGGRGLRAAGQQAVPLSDIVGTVDAGRHPFDRRFDPTDDAAWPRFSTLFAARSRGTSLPPVTLYRAADGYYVLDGHHRVAVARAFGDADIWAEVMLVRD